MRSRGYDLPLFPVVYVDAADEEEAKQKLLRCDSRYGTITAEGYMEYTEGMVIMTEELSIPELNLSVGEYENKNKEVDLDDLENKDKETCTCPKCGFIFEK
jgi:tetrahydromethanopterin S-methyltransferase subunit G